MRIALVALVLGIAIGIFLFAARTMIEAFKTHAPEYLAPVQAALTEARSSAPSQASWAGPSIWRAGSST